MLLRSIALVPIIVAIGCGGSNIKAHDTGTVEHERAAREHEASAANLEASCDQKRRGDSSVAAAGAPCWKAGDKRTIDAHRDAAAQHRAASAALRAAEAQACIGISDEDRDMSPFEHVGDITSVELLSESVPISETDSLNAQVGAVVVFRAVPGMTAEWLQRVVDCHLARNAALGHVVPEMPSCPLVPRGVAARVRSSGNGFAVEIKANDAATAREILARAQRLGSPRASSQR